MVIFLLRFQDPERGSPPVYARPTITAEFPRHKIVIAELEAFSPYTDLHIGRMYHYRSQRRGHANIISSFVSWHCIQCGVTHFRFTDNNIWTPDVGSYRSICEPSDVVEGPYFRGATPSVRYLLFPRRHGGGDHKPPFLLIGFFVRNCSRCERQHWYALNVFWWDEVGGRWRYLCFGGQPINYGINFSSWFMTYFHQEGAHVADHYGPRDNNAGVGPAGNAEGGDRGGPAGNGGGDTQSDNGQ